MAEVTKEFIEFVVNRDKVLRDIDDITKRMSVLQSNTRMSNRDHQRSWTQLKRQVESYTKVLKASYMETKIANSNDRNENQKKISGLRIANQEKKNEIQLQKENERVIRQQVTQLRSYYSQMMNIGNSLSGTGNKMLSIANPLKSTVNQVLAMVSVTRLAGKGFNILTDSIHKAVSAYDRIYQAKNIYKALGFDDKTIKENVDTIIERIMGLPTTMDTAQNSIKKFVTLQGVDLDGATDMFSSLNNAMLSTGTNAQDMEHAMDAVFKMVSKKSADMRWWTQFNNRNLLANLEVADAFGFKDAMELREALMGESEITWKQYFDKLAEIAKDGTTKYGRLALKNSMTFENMGGLFQTRLVSRIRVELENIDKEIIKIIDEKDEFGNDKNWKDVGIGVLENYTSALKEAFGGIDSKAIAKWVIDFAKNLDFKPVIQGIKDFGLFIFEMGKMAVEFGKALGAVGKFVGGGNTIEGFKRMLITWISVGALMSGAGFITKIIFGIKRWKLSLLNVNDLAKTGNDVLGKSGDINKLNAVNFAGILKSLKPFALVLAGIGTVFAGAKALEYVNSLNLDMNTLVPKLGAVTATVGVMSGLILAISKISSLVGGTTLVLGGLVIVGAIATIITMSKAIKEMDDNIQISFIDTLKKLGIISTVLVGMSAVLAGIGFAMASFPVLGVSMIAGFVGANGTAFSIIQLSKSINSLEGISLDRDMVLQKLGIINDVIVGFTSFEIFKSNSIIETFLKTLDSFAKRIIANNVDKTITSITNFISGFSEIQNSEISVNLLEEKFSELNQSIISFNKFDFQAIRNRDSSLTNIESLEALFNNIKKVSKYILEIQKLEINKDSVKGVLTDIKDVVSSMEGFVEYFSGEGVGKFFETISQTIKVPIEGNQATKETKSSRNIMGTFDELNKLFGKIREFSTQLSSMQDVNIDSNKVDAVLTSINKVFQSFDKIYADTFSKENQYMTDERYNVASKQIGHIQKMMEAVTGAVSKLPDTESIGRISEVIEALGSEINYVNGSGSVDLFATLFNTLNGFINKVPKLNSDFYASGVSFSTNVINGFKSKMAGNVFGEVILSSLNRSSANNEKFKNVGTSIGNHMVNGIKLAIKNSRILEYIQYQIEKAIYDDEMYDRIRKKPKKTGTTKKTGKVQYLSRGGFAKKGTDTIPAMLTEGEYVLRKSATKLLGSDLLDRLNNTKVSDITRLNGLGGRTTTKTVNTTRNEKNNNVNIVQKFENTNSRQSLGVVNRKLKFL